MDEKEGYGGSGREGNGLKGRGGGRGGAGGVFVAYRVWQGVARHAGGARVRDCADEVHISVMRRGLSIPFQEDKIILGINCH